MPRRGKPRTIGAEEAMKANVSAWLEDQERGVTWLATKMTEAGCPIATTGVWKMLNSDRTIYVNEAVALSQVLGVSLSDLASEEWKP